MPVQGAKSVRKVCNNPPREEDAPIGAPKSRRQRRKAEREMRRAQRAR